MPRTHIAGLEKKVFRKWSLIILVATFVLYGNSIGNEYALDDEIVTVTNPDNPDHPNHPRVAKGFAGLGEIFTTHYAKSNKASYGYRPLVLASYAIEYQFFGANPHVSHFFNVLLYALTCILLFYLLLKLFRDRKFHMIFPLFITFLFLAHPLHTEIVNNIKSRDELLFFLFGLLAIVMYVRFMDAQKMSKMVMYLLLGVFCIFLAALAKKTTVAFLGVIPFTLYFFRTTNWKKIGIATLSIASVFATFVLIKKGLVKGDHLREILYFENPLVEGSSLVDRIPVALYTYAYYLKLMVLPHPLSFYYGYNYVPIAGWDNIWVWISVVIHLPMWGYAIMKLKSKHVLAYCIIIYTGVLFGFSNLPLPIVGIVGERFAYIPTLGFCIAVGWFLLKAFKVPFDDEKVKTLKIPNGLKAALTILLLLYSGRVIVRNMDWENHLSLYRHDIQHLENSTKAHSLLAGTVAPLIIKEPSITLRKQMTEEAKYHFRRALEIYPNYTTCYNNLGTIIYSFDQDYRTAKPLFLTAIKQDSAYVEGHFNAGMSYDKLGMLDSSMYHYQKAVFFGNQHPERVTGILKRAYSNLSMAYVKRSMVQEATKLNLDAIDLFPDAPEYYLNLGNLYAAEYDTIVALSYYEKGFTMVPNNYRLCVHIGQLYAAIGNQQKAGEYFQKAQFMQQSQQQQ